MQAARQGWGTSRGRVWPALRRAALVSVYRTPWHFGCGCCVGLSSRLRLGQSSRLRAAPRRPCPAFPKERWGGRGCDAPVVLLLRPAARTPEAFVVRVEHARSSSSSSRSTERAHEARGVRGRVSMLSAAVADPRRGAMDRRWSRKENAAWWAKKREELAAKRKDGSVFERFRLGPSPPQARQDGPSGK